MREVRGERTKAILEHLLDAAATSAELFVAIVEAGYGASHGQIMKKLDEVQSRKGKGVKKPEALKSRRKSFYATLYRLKREGFIDSQGGKWSLTKEGKTVLGRIHRYQEEPSDTFKIVAFDIPEEVANQRVWLRSALKNLGFKLLQRSVWIGKVKLPERFIRELRERGLIDYVEILSITKGGSLKGIKQV